MNVLIRIILYVLIQVQEFVHDYTYCTNDGPINHGKQCSELINSSTPQECICNINFTLSEPFKVMLCV